ncbi:hypothetical protein Tco_1110133 [Tanacetum coccineum]|uniref:Reverse transcriptase Ty1/copia-type domain-containing protein n=1 Tax=Tanacetum coccineum TaxID=301880 RepID=A0ABQ5IJD4_9ASTR
MITMDQRSSIRNKLWNPTMQFKQVDWLCQDHEMCMFARTEEGIIDFERIICTVASLGSSSDFRFAYAAPSLFQSTQMDVKTAFLNGPLKEEVFVLSRRVR